MESYKYNKKKNLILIGDRDKLGYNIIQLDVKHVRI